MPGLQPLDCSHVPLLVDSVELHDQLIDPAEHVVRCREERVPFRPLDVDFNDETFAAVAVPRELAGD